MTKLKLSMEINSRKLEMECDVTTFWHGTCVCPPTCAHGFTRCCGVCENFWDCEDEENSCLYVKNVTPSL